MYIGKHFSSSELEEQPPLKRLKIEQNEITEQNPFMELTDFPLDIFFKILGIISLNGCLLMNQLSKKHSFHMEYYWRALSQQNKWDFEWAESQTYPYPAQLNYFQTFLISDYVNRRPSFFPINNNVKIRVKNKLLSHSINETWIKNPFLLHNLWVSLEKYFISFPLVGTYIWQDVSYFRNLSVRKILLAPPRFKSKEMDLENHSLKKYGGDELLKGLFFLTKYFEEILIYDASTKTYLLQGKEERSEKSREFYATAFGCLKEAMIQKATCASSLAIKVFTPLQNLTQQLHLAGLSGDHSSFCYDLALLSNKLGDDRGLKAILNPLFSSGEQVKSMYQLVCRHPHVLIRMVELEPDLHKQEALLDTICQNYDPTVPLEGWIYWVIIKRELGKKEIAQPIIDRLIDSYGSYIFYEQAYLKLTHAYSQISETFNSENIKFEALKDIQNGCRNKCNIKFINRLMTHAIELSTSLPSAAWFYAASLKIWIEEWDQAILYINQLSESQHFDFFSTGEVIDESFFHNERKLLHYSLLLFLSSLSPTDKNFGSYIKGISLETWVKAIIQICHDPHLCHDTHLSEGLQSIESIVIPSLEKVVRVYEPQVPQTLWLLTALAQDTLHDLWEPGMLSLSQALVVPYNEDKEIKYQEFLTLLCYNINGKEVRDEEEPDPNPEDFPFEFFYQLDLLYSYTFNQAITWLEKIELTPHLLPPLFWRVFSQRHVNSIRLMEEIQKNPPSPPTQAFILTEFCNYHLNNIRRVCNNDGTLSIYRDVTIHELENWIEQALACYKDLNPPSWIWTTYIKIKKLSNEESEVKQIVAREKTL